MATVLFLCFAAPSPAIGNARSTILKNSRLNLKFQQEQVTQDFNCYLNFAASCTYFGREVMPFLVSAFVCNQRCAHFRET